MEDLPDEQTEIIEDLTKQAQEAILAILRRERDSYIKRLEAAPTVPTMAIVEARALSMVRQDENIREIPEPSPDFENWVTVNIINPGYEEQLELWVEESGELMENAAVLFGQMAFLELGVDLIFNETDERLARWLSERSRREAQLIKGATDEEVIMTLWDVVMDGNYSIPKFVEALEESFAFSEKRAERIARTEVISASRAGQYHGDMQSGLVIGKKWMAANQERTRPGHRGANGQIVAFDEPFLVANGNGQLEPLMFPGDTSLGASASNVIQCRCWYKRILEGEEME